ncbi:Hypothetical predicted protein, partial [Paramuricea clavata]
MSLEDYRKSKSKHWKSLVSKGTKKGKQSPQEVTIIISLYEWNDKEDKLKPKRGKRISLKVSPVDPYARILEKAATKWRDFYSDCFNEEEDYVLLLENGKEALFLSGGKEFFTLKRYRKEVGKEFSKIILYLCSRSDFDTSEESRSGFSPCLSTSTIKTGDTFNADGDPEYIWEESDRNDAKRFRQDQERNETSDESEIMNQIRNDEVLARELQRTDDIIAQEIQVELKTDSVIEDNNDNKNDSDPSNFHDISSLVKSLQGKIDRSGEFFLVVRRGLSRPGCGGLYYHLKPEKSGWVFSSRKKELKHSESSPDSQPNVTRLKRGESSPDCSRNLYPKECNFCKKYRVKKNGKLHFPITIATNMAAAQIKESAEAKDTKLFYEIRDIDLIAKEFKYHDFCYREFARKVANANTKQFEDNDAKDTRYRSKLKNRIVTKFPDQLLFLTIDALQVVISREGTNKNTLLKNREEVIKQAAEYLREDIREYARDSPELQWPPYIEELAAETRPVPSS